MSNDNKSSEAGHNSIITDIMIPNSTKNIGIQDYKASSKGSINFCNLCSNDSLTKDVIFFNLAR